MTSFSPTMQRVFLGASQLKLFQMLLTDTHGPYQIAILKLKVAKILFFPRIACSLYD